HRPKPPSLRERARALLAIVRPVAVHVDVKTVLKAAAHKTTDRAIDHAADRADRAARPQPRPQPQPQPQPDTGNVQPDPQPIPIHVDRTDHSKPTVFVARWQTRGGKASCEVYTTKDECTQSCTNLLRAHSMRKPDDNTPQGCTCLEQDGGC
ncbi:MAG TPA: hypothetical protein VIU61_09365, partial [Kofleriaceae bacterium]